MILNVVHTVRLGDRCLLLGALAIWCNLLVAWYHGGFWWDAHWCKLLVLSLVASEILVKPGAAKSWMRRLTGLGGNLLAD